MSQPRYIESQGMWLLPVSEAVDCEVLVAGDSNGPDASSFAEAEAMLPSLAALRDRAAAYLDEFVDRGALEPGSDWFLEGIEFSRIDEFGARFVLSFSLEGDTYGSWSVTFRLTSGQYSPIAFGRQQI